MNRRTAAVLVICLIFIFFGGAFLSAETDVTPRNVAQYLETGEMSYTIDVNFTRIAWEPEDLYLKEIRKAEETLARDSDDLEAVIDYIQICSDADRNDLARETAEMYVEQFFQAYKTEQNETSARNLVIATNKTGPKEAYVTAYEAVRPFLEQGNAGLATVFAAIENRELAEDYHLGFRIAEFYQEIYPDNAELFFRGFLLTLNNSLHRTIPYMISAIHGQIDDLERYLQEYFGALENSIYLDLLDRALEIEPDNYQYLLASVGFRAMVRWFSILGTLMQEENSEMDTLQDLFNLLNTAQDERLKKDMQKALKRRPENDVQIYLAAALFHATGGDARHAGEYVRKALQVRTDMPEIYDAHVFSVMLEVAAQDAEPSIEQREQIEKILREKMQHTGKNAYDLYVLSVLQFIKIREGVTERERVRLLEEMEGYIDESAALEDSVLAGLIRGNIALLENRADDAVEIYQEEMARSPEDQLFMLHANLGVAYMMQDKAELGKKEIRTAIELSDGGLHAEELLAE